MINRYSKYWEENKVYSNGVYFVNIDSDENYKVVNKSEELFARFKWTFSHLHRPEKRLFIFYTKSQQNKQGAEFLAKNFGVKFQERNEFKVESLLKDKYFDKEKFLVSIENLKQEFKESEIIIFVEKELLVLI
jgi:hypothetical protein